MSKIVIDIEGTLKKGDILIYEGDKLKPVNSKIFLKELDLKVRKLEVKNKELSDNFEKLKLAVNDKLENYHNILQLLTKEEK